MRQKKLCGYDLNGWRDIAARNWSFQPGEEEVFTADVLSEGGLLTSVVSAGEVGSARWVGGAEAALAPHGRGGGWGQIGDIGKRKSVRALIESGGCNSNELAAAYAGLARNSDCAVASIDDLPSTTEKNQENLLSALLQAGATTRLLVWRPVLVALYAIGEGIVRDGHRVGVICHAPDGFALQILRIRREDSQTSAILAPERRTFGKSVSSRMGYRSLVEAARTLVFSKAVDRETETLQALAAIGRLTMGLAAPPELIRRANGTWREIAAIAPPVPPQSDLLPDDFEALSSCDIVLFETLTEGNLKGYLNRVMEKVCAPPLLEVPYSAVATGALLAARRVASRDPVYFDFLPRIATIVQGAEGAQNYELISAEENLPAGRLYRSEQPAKLAVLGEQQRFTVFIRKEAVRWPRKAVVDMGTPLPETTPVQLFVEQAPASGRARILVQTPDSRQFSVDWETAEEIEEDWEKIIANLASPLPTIPNRLVLPCGAAGWEGDGGSPGLRSLLDANAGAQTVDWRALAERLTQCISGRYCISSDGELPGNSSQGDVKRLDRLTTRALELLRDAAAGRTAVNTKVIQFLTWQFRRCPADVLPIMLRAWHSQGLLNQHHLRRVLFYQGVGRIAADADQERTVLGTLLRTPVDRWRWREETACAAFILSRSDTAPLLLSREQVEAFGTRVLMEFEEALGSSYTEFNYAPLLLVGLLRWRLKEPRALVASTDLLAKRFSTAVGAILVDFQSRLVGHRAARRYEPLMQQIQAELAGKGTNPDLLLDIYSSTSSP